jgi:hypothetical protein
VRLKYLIVVPKPMLFFASFWSWCPGRCRGAATLSQQDKNYSSDDQWKSVNFTRLKR